MSNKESSLKSFFEQLFAEETSICLWFSGGNDSRLLLETMLEFKKPFGVLRMDTGWSREQRRKVDAIIIKHNLQVFSYLPTLQMLIADGEEISFVCGYAINAAGTRAILLCDLVEGDACAFDLKTSEQARFAQAPVEFDVHIWGSRTTDVHYSVGTVIPGAEWESGGKRFLAPLADWSRTEVLAALATRGIGPNEAISGDLACCHNCLKGSGVVFCPKAGKQIESVIWDPAANLKMFREMLRHT